MLTFVGRRLAQAVLLVLGALTIVFVVVRVVPGDPAKLMLGNQATDGQIAQLRDQLGLSDPLWLQYVHYLADIVRGDFGESWRIGGSALSVVAERLPATLILASYAMVLTIAVGFPLGIYCARRVGSWADHLVSSVSLVGQALPAFWVGIMLILLFTRTLNVLPSTADGTPQALLLPAITLALPFLGWLARLVRNGALEEMNRDYVRTAKSKGLSARVVFYVHVMRNTLVPVVTVLGLLMGNFIADAVIVENVIAWPGIGSLMVESITNRDYSVVQATIAAITVGYIVLNLVVDVLYFYLDPRIASENT
ncbi:MAG: ABC transporter permease subunit [Streptosporangiales bacterium]|nr:ABC transporter permease subunit [Streptosporangiales bacterium]